MKIKVLMIPADRPAYVTNIENNLNNFQRNVGGYIQAVYLAEDTALICNEEGKLMGLQVNKNIPKHFIRNDIIVGDCFICGVAGENFCDINDSAKRPLLDAFRRAWADNNLDVQA